MVHVDRSCFAAFGCINCPTLEKSPAPERFMRKVVLPALCMLVWTPLWPSRCWAQAGSKLAPEVRAFVKEDARRCREDGAPHGIKLTGHLCSIGFREAALAGH